MGLAGLVGLVLRRPGHRGQLPAAGPCLDAIHPSGSRTDGGSGVGAAGVAAVGCLAPGPGGGLLAPTATHRRGGGSDAGRSMNCSGVVASQVC